MDSRPNAVPGGKRPRWPWTVLRLGCRYALAAALLMAAVTKITDLPGFEDRMWLRTAWPAAVVVAVVHVLPWLELTCGACLAVGYAVREAALLSALLLAVFLAYALVEFGQPDCGCLLFPTLQLPEWPWWQAVRNLLLLGCALLTAWKQELGTQAL